MSLFTRSLISVFSGIGAGTVGFWLVWTLMASWTRTNPGIAHDVWLLVGIFAPGILAALTVYHVLRGHAEPEPAALT